MSTRVITSTFHFSQAVIGLNSDRLQARRMRTETLTYLKEHANNLELDSPLLVTQNGKARYVVQDAADYQYQQESLALLKLLTLSEQTIDKGILSLDDAFDES